MPYLTYPCSHPPCPSVPHRAALLSMLAMQCYVPCRVLTVPCRVLTVLSCCSCWCGSTPVPGSPPAKLTTQSADTTWWVGFFLLATLLARFFCVTDAPTTKSSLLLSCAGSLPGSYSSSSLVKARTLNPLCSPTPPTAKPSSPDKQIHNTSKMGQTVWRFTLCACLFSLALAVTAFLGKMLGRHFYNTAHFNKVCVVLGVLEVCALCMLVCPFSSISSLKLWKTLVCVGQQLPNHDTHSVKAHAAPVFL